MDSFPSGAPAKALADIATLRAALDASSIPPKTLDRNSVDCDVERARFRQGPAQVGECRRGFATPQSARHAVPGPHGWAQFQ